MASMVELGWSESLTTATTLITDKKSKNKTTAKKNGTD